MKSIVELRAQISSMKQSLGRTVDKMGVKSKAPIDSNSHDRREHRWGYNDCPDHVTYRKGQGRHNTDSNAKRKQKQPVTVKAATYDGTTSWIDYRSHFEACARINDWSHYEKGLHLAVALRGQAQGILGDLAVSQQQDFFSLINSLEERFSPPDQIELYSAQLLERKQKASETLPELGKAGSRLVNLAYTTVPSDVRETLAKQQFIEALSDSGMRIRIKQARPRNLMVATRLAVELEAYNRCEKQYRDGRNFLRAVTTDTGANIGEAAQADSKKTPNKESSGTVSLLRDIQKKLADVQIMKEKKDRKVASSTNSRASGQACFYCKKEGHLRPDCPKLKKTQQSRPTNQQLSE
ncbi:hypothetical protein KP79_PYT26157 [Mizuhopecten yessoensis]|uniref:CCHC-type domain-containing protein n=1 Tax=Mizuhopecten yessoensis TaxID=6573 RepID=A0A210QG43_MIZYE|nr:hypothetical protein KP79_PYT26157 [Mizuhopecten yessoensis]